MALRGSTKLLAFSCFVTAALVLAFAPIRTAIPRLASPPVGSETSQAFPGKTLHLNGKRSGGLSEHRGKVVLISKTTHELGVVAQGEAGSHSFELRNVGPGDLHVQLADKSCGCLSVRLDGVRLKSRALQAPFPPDSPLHPVPERNPNASVMPFAPQSRDPDDRRQAMASPPQLPLPNPLPNGPSLLPIPPTEAETSPAVDEHIVRADQTVGIEVSINTNNTIGNIHQFAKILTSDPAHPIVELRLEGNVVPRIELSHRWLDLPGLRTDRPAHGTFRVTSRVLQDLQIKHALSSDPSIKVQADRMENETLAETGAKVGYEVQLNIPVGQPVGRLTADVTLVTNQPNQPVITVPISGNVEGDVKLMPYGTLNFGQLERKNGGTQGLYAKVLTVEMVDVNVVNVEPDFLKVELHCPNGLRDGQQFVIIEGTVPPEAPVGEFVGQIDLQTTHPTSKTVRIRVHGIVRGAADRAPDLRPNE